MIYKVTATLNLPERANPRYQDLNVTEYRRAEKTAHGYGRVIGGDKGDLLFNGYSLTATGTDVHDPALSTTIEGLTQDEVNEIAAEILNFSFDSIGIETVEHS